ncbi:MAG: ABC transporter permease [Candidatus Accumulibacter sp.]|nr:ABC transporter permease [Accumulibacter sp.]
MLIRLAALWKKECLALARDRHGLAALFIMPTVFILVMSLALADSLSGQRNATLAYATLDLDGTPVSRALDEQLSATELLNRQVSPPSEDDARSQVETGRLAFVLIIPQGFARQIGANQTPTLRFLVDPAIPGMVRNGFRQHVEAIVIRVWLAHVLEHLGQSMMLPELHRVTGRVGAPDIVLESVTHGGSGGAPLALPSAVQQNVPAWLIFSMFFVVIPISAVFIGERQRGTLQRLRAQRVSFGLVLAGKFAPFVLVNQLQAVVMVAIGRWLVPLFGGEALTLPDGAGALAALWLLSLAVSAAAVGWALLIASLARSSEQATVLGGGGNILMGAIGGIMVPRFVMPVTMQPWTRLSPMDWALEGFHHVMLRQGNVMDILPAAFMLACFGLATLIAASLLNHRISRA